jgi:hypothetical protein
MGTLSRIQSVEDARLLAKRRVPSGIFQMWPLPADRGYSLRTLLRMDRSNIMSGNVLQR